MPVVNDEFIGDNGMFRSYYDCWKEFIAFIKEGIDRIGENEIYKVRLDIRKFYDNLTMSSIRNVLYPAIKEALGCSDRFESIFSNTEDRDIKAKEIYDWISRELFHYKYICPKTGEIKFSEYALLGIPQGPNLSSYVANIALFPLDKAVFKIVNELNKDCKGNKIRIRYARYVDDMVIISDSSIALNKVKGVIIEELTKIDLELSTKTDDAEKIDKEDAYNWLVDEKGGLGVSNIFDFPDEPIEDIIDEYYDFEIVDRREALKMLGNMIFDFDNINNNVEHFIEIFFKTNDVRYSDIIKFSEVLIRYLRRSNSLSIIKYKVIYEENCRLSSEDSILNRTEIICLSLLDGIERILKSKSTYNLTMEERNERENDKKAIIECMIKNNKLVTYVLEEIVNKRVENNQNAIQYKTLSIINQAITLSNKDIAEEIHMCLNSFMSTHLEKTYFQENSQLYLRRWKYSLYYCIRSKEIESNSASYFSTLDSIDIREKFHWVCSRLISCRNMNEFNDAESMIQNSIKSWNITNDLFDNCLQIWFNNSSQKHDDKVDFERALRIIINITSKDLLSEIINKNTKIKNYLFKNNKSIVYLPVPPGIDYNGIIAIKGSKEPIRVDFIEYNNNIGGLRWEKDNAISGIEKFKAKWDNQYKNLDDFFESIRKEERYSPELIKNIVDIYKKLHDYLIAENTQNERLALSKYHIFVNNELDIKAITYKIEVNKINSFVGVSSGYNSLKMIDVPTQEYYYWQIGQVLGDALRLNEEILEENEEKDEYYKQIIFYSFERLKGEWQNKSCIIKNGLSINKSIDRTLKSLEDFVVSNNKGVALFDTIIINNFISFRMNQKNYTFINGELEYQLALWSKNVISKEYTYLSKMIKLANTNYKIVMPNILDRHVSKTYFLIAIQLSKIIESENSFIGLKALRSGLFANSILVNLRMQVLERFMLLTDEEIQFLIKRELPYSYLGLDTSGTTAFFSNSACQEVEMDQIKENLLKKCNCDKIKNVTLIGWLLLFVWVLELDENNKITKPRLKKKFTEKITSKIKNLKELLIISDDLNNNSSFPFEGINEFIRVFDENHTLEIIAILNEIDQFDNVVIEKKSSPYFSYKKNNINQISLTLDGQRLNNRPIYFITDAKVGISGKRKEMDIVNDENAIWTQTIIDNNIVGVSIISDKLAKLINIPIVNYVEKESSKENNTKTNFDLNKVENNVNHEITDKNKSNDEPENSISDNKVCFNNFNGDSFKNAIKEIEKRQNDSWIKRREKPASLDRIAIFQFEVDDSYQHPLIEICLEQDNLNRSDIELARKNPCIWKTTKEYGSNEFSFRSCAEYRRRKLLKKVFEVCSCFGVEILLLPEYSVRHDTVEWMLEEIKVNEYKFSVWAGTFRLTPDSNLGSCFDGKLNNMSAILPIICNKTDNTLFNDKYQLPKIITDRVKKYPALALEEVFNPPYIDEQIFESVMKKHFESQLFRDARDDVIELICAEMFMISSPTNFSSFAKASYDLYKRFSKNHMSYKDYYDFVVKDIIRFSARTSLHQDKDKYGRASIILVPAYTTRAVDYYVAAQAGYLASGLTTVFCNAVGVDTVGGSCFIGTGSWDNHAGSKSEYLPDYTIYHGITPGIYQQFLKHEDRGGLGEREQALLICDIDPNISFKGKPNPQSCGSPLNLVAHLPIIESNKVLKKKDLNKIGLYINKDNRFLCRCKKSENRVIISNECRSCTDKKICLRSDYLMMSIIDLFDYLVKYDGIISSTIEDKEPHKIREFLCDIGDGIGNKWLNRRGEKYVEQHISNPQIWPPPTSLDWIWVDVDFKDEYKKQDIKIDIPKFSNKDNCKNDEESVE